MLEVVAGIQGTVVRIEVEVGTAVRDGQRLVVLESMKMEHPVTAPCDGFVDEVRAVEGAIVAEGDVLVCVRPSTSPKLRRSSAPEVVDGRDLGRGDLEQVVERHAVGLDVNRPDAVARRHGRGQRTARENIADLLDPESFVEYGPLLIAGQRRRREVQELIERTPADGLVGGLGKVGGRSIVVASYDYMVLAGTQGMWNHAKKDRLFEIAERLRLPVVFFTEGGGGRPGDTDGSSVAGLDTMAFHLFARLSGLAPLVGIVSGRCFAGNAAILGCCDVVIATEGANIGMGGPAMIDGGGLGQFEPEEIGPVTEQVANGVVDILAADEAAAVSSARRYLAYFVGERSDERVCADQAVLRDVVPENRVEVYDVRAAITGLCDTGSVLELRTGFGRPMITALARIDGRAVGVLANDPRHLGGAIDADAADKAARFLQLCDAFDLPIVSLCDTPGFMVGPDAERTALVRHVSRMFVTGANLDVPYVLVVLRKAYGLGAQAMASGSLKVPLAAVAWPTGEFGGMNLEGFVRLGFRRELDAVDDPAERARLHDEMVERMYEHGTALNTATHFEIDDVIDPAETRHWITAVFDAAPSAPPRHSKKRPFIDTW